MKKKLLLTVLPVLMALSGCANVNITPAEKVDNNPVDVMVEDTIAREDVFGPAQEAKELKIKKLNDLHDESNYKIGYQLHFDDKGNADNSDDVLSIRFIAAIKQEYQSMVWSRGLSRGDGSETKPFGNTKQVGLENVPLASTVVYTSLSNGGEDIMVAGSDPYDDYVGFIVYSLTDIPYELYKDSFLAVSLTLDPNTAVSNDETITSIYAVKIEGEPNMDLPYVRSKMSFSFEYNVNEYNGYFLYGLFNDALGGSYRTIPADNPTVGSNNASYSHLSLIGADECDFNPFADDKPYNFPDAFNSFYFKDSTFKYFSSEQHDYTDSGVEWSYFDESSSYFNYSDGAVCAKVSDEYAIFISSGNANHVYSMIYGQDTRYTCYNLPGWVGSGVDLFASVQYSDSTWHWISASMSEGNMVFDAPNTALKFLLVRCKTGTTTPNWSATGDNVGRIYNQTGDISVSFGTYSYEASIWSDYNP